MKFVCGASGAQHTHFNTARLDRPASADRLLRFLQRDARFGNAHFLHRNCHGLGAAQCQIFVVGLVARWIVKARYERLGARIGLEVFDNPRQIAARTLG